MCPKKYLSFYLGDIVYHNMYNFLIFTIYIKRNEKEVCIVWERGFDVTKQLLNDLVTDTCPGYMMDSDFNDKHFEMRATSGCPCDEIR